MLLHTSIVLLWGYKKKHPGFTNIVSASLHEDVTNFLGKIVPLVIDETHTLKHVIRQLVALWIVQPLNTWLYIYIILSTVIMSRSTATPVITACM